MNLKLARQIKKIPNRFSYDKKTVSLSLVHGVIRNYELTGFD